VIVEQMKRLFGVSSISPPTERTRAVEEFVRSVALVTDPATLQISITNWWRHLTGYPDGVFLAASHDGTFRPTFATIDVPTDGLAFSGEGRLCNWLRVNRAILAVPDRTGVWDYLSEHERTALRDAQVRMCVPLAAVNTLSAVVLIVGPKPTALSVSELAQFQGLIAQAALAYDQARAFESQRERLDSLYRAEQLIVAGQLAATVAHEVKNPLATIRATLQYLASTDPREARERVEAAASVHRGG
jgi:signal transduction histidine kinase